MPGEPASTPLGADAYDLAAQHARTHLGPRGYRLLEDHHDRRSGTRLLVMRSMTRRELVFCELCVERPGGQTPPAAGQRRRLRRAALTWLTANPAVKADALRFDRLTVVVGHDGLPLGLEHEPQAF